MASKKDITTKTSAELTIALNEARAKLAQLRFDAADRKLKRTSDLAATRKEIAQILTALRTAK